LALNLEDMTPGERGQNHGDVSPSLVTSEEGPTGRPKNIYAVRVKEPRESTWIKQDFSFTKERSTGSGRERSLKKTRLQCTGHEAAIKYRLKNYKEKKRENGPIQHHEAVTCRDLHKKKKRTASWGVRPSLVGIPATMLANRSERRASPAGGGGQQQIKGSLEGKAKPATDRLLGREKKNPGPPLGKEQFFSRPKAASSGSVRERGGRSKKARVAQQFKIQRVLCLREAAGRISVKRIGEKSHCTVTYSREFTGAKISQIREKVKNPAGRIEHGGFHLTQ